MTHRSIATLEVKSSISAPIGFLTRGWSLLEVRSQPHASRRRLSCCEGMPAATRTASWTSISLEQAAVGPVVTLRVISEPAQLGQSGFPVGGNASAIAITFGPH
jgi:hypothetical protein